ncbi:hypothetical protein XbrCFBP1976_22025, partial [Xanthomonas bromi]
GLGVGADVWKVQADYCGADFSYILYKCIYGNTILPLKFVDFIRNDKLHIQVKIGLSYLIYSWHRYSRRICPVVHHLKWITCKPIQYTFFLGFGASPHIHLATRKKQLLSAARRAGRASNNRQWLVEAQFMRR